MNDVNLKRIADAMEEILRLVKADQEADQKRWEYNTEEKERESTTRASKAARLPPALDLGPRPSAEPQSTRTNLY